MVSFDKVETALETAKGIAFDTCHKIYVLMDEDQVELMREYEYDEIRSIADISKESMLELLKDWYASSCSLRFIQSVRTTSPDDEDSGYDDLISQFEEIDEDGMYQTKALDRKVEGIWLFEKINKQAKQIKKKLATLFD